MVVKLGAWSTSIDSAMRLFCQLALGRRRPKGSRPLLVCRLPLLTVD
jgi:hypothetical protein